MDKLSVPFFDEQKMSVCLPAHYMQNFVIGLLELKENYHIQLLRSNQVWLDSLCYVMLCYVMLCYVMLCYVMLCYVMLCHVMLWSVLQHNFVISFDAYNLRNYGSQLWINFHQSILIILMLSSYFFRISKKFERNFSHIIQILANSIIKHLISTKSTCTMCFYDF